MMMAMMIMAKCGHDEDIGHGFDTFCFMAIVIMMTFSVNPDDDGNDDNGDDNEEMLP